MPMVYQIFLSGVQEKIFKPRVKPQMSLSDVQEILILSYTILIRGYMYIRILEGQAFYVDTFSYQNVCMMRGMSIQV